MGYKKTPDKLEYSEEAKSVLDDLRKACNPKGRIVEVKNLVY